jgi:ferrous iron transport protein B
MSKDTLNNLKKGQDAIIESINCSDKILRNHILDMGLTPGVEVTLIKAAPFGDPLEFRLRGYELTLRKDTAAKIKIKDIHNSDSQKRKTKEFSGIEHSLIGENISYIQRKKVKAIIRDKVSFALIGNQNCGKTTLFNKLTGSNQHVGNFPGVTIDRTDGFINQNKNLVLTDLPGVYSLMPYGSEEIITRNFILKEKPDAIINIIDATNIERNLLLTLQLIELNVPMVIALNMMDEIEANHGSIDVNGIENALGVPVVPISAVKGEGLEELVEHAINVAIYEERPSRLDFCKNDDGKDGAVHRCIHSIIELIEDHAKAASLPTRFAVTKLIEDDKITIEALHLDKNELHAIEHLISEMEQETSLDRYAAIASMRFNFIDEMSNAFVSKPDDSAEYKFSAMLDRVLTGKYSAIPVFILIISLILYMTFGTLGAFLSSIMEKAIAWTTLQIDNALTLYGLNKVVHSLIIDGICTGVGTVLNFLPIIVILFFFLSILEDTGYMARVAFVMDKLLRKIGLSGRSFVPMLIGFGCSVPAIMATRTLPSERDRKMTILLTPFMSCSAKLPIYALFTAAFFTENKALVVISLYLIGIIVGIIFAYILKLLVFKGKPVPFVMELPNYRFPSAVNVYRLIYMKAKDFITRAFGVILLAALVIWFLENFDLKMNLVTDTTNSILANIANLITPIFHPLGITDWRISTAFISGFMAKESVVSTLGVLVGKGSENLHEIFSNLSAFVFLVFCLLYTPCAAAIATVKKELGRRWACGVVLIQCLIAWIVAFIVYTLGSLFVG